MLEDWEQKTQDLYEQWYHEGNYSLLLADYCHEGLILEDNPPKAIICSAIEEGETKEKSIKNLADCVIKRVREGWLGC